MKRSQTAFVVAPLWVPLLVTSAVFLLGGSQLVIITAVLSTVFAYLGTYGLGWPLFAFLVSRNWTAPWIAIVSGCFLGITTWLAFLICFSLSLGEGVGEIGTAFQPHLEELAILGIAAFLGGLVGGTLWMVARPDLARGADSR